MMRSLRVRLMIGAATLAILFMLALLPALQRAFSIALEDAIQQRLAADIATLVSSARIEGDRLDMPEHLAVEDFNLPESKLLGFIYDRDGKLVWRAPQDSGLSDAYTEPDASLSLRIMLQLIGPLAPDSLL